ncbi:DUF5995 family protein [Halogeometricum luteum]|uniref:DUF5995 family protein n=1 Tax=Halogeometricum luteum TaxID=2950537 RepID=A0ABU2G673_9EURY|nr:DUF5995 family protein [Halogeometricum sp. S3BR5-2]MDS0296298.1 DUF5995 family protein [Halogeometricum sp. S3BR5-2]
MQPTARSSGPARRRRRVRAAAEGVRRRPPTPSARQSDPELLALSAEPYADADEAHDRLRALCAAFEARGDRRAAFLSVYVRMTGAVAERIRRGAFEDPEWVHDYLVAFANLYRVAVHDYESGNFASLADPWLLAFDAAERGDSLVVQDAALGVNAHINYDLSLAVAAVDVDPDRAIKRADHRAVTDVIRDVVDATQDALAARDAAGLRALDESLGPFDERFLVFTVDECRDSAWRTAVALRSRSRLRRRLARWTNAVTSTGAAHLILSSRANDRVHESLRALERAAEEER